MCTMAHNAPSIMYVTRYGEGGPAKDYHIVLLLLKFIKILTESVAWGEGFKICRWPYTIYGQLPKGTYFFIFDLTHNSNRACSCGQRDPHLQKEFAVEQILHESANTFHHRFS